MGTKAHAWVNGVVVDHAEGTEAHALRIVIIAEAESMPAFKPPMIGNASSLGLVSYHGPIPCYVK
jgi:hypothetical protein